MKNENTTHDNQGDKKPGFPIQATLLLAVLILSVFVLILKFAGVI